LDLNFEGGDALFPDAGALGPLFRGIDFADPSSLAMRHETLLFQRFPARVSQLQPPRRRPAPIGPANHRRFDRTAVASAFDFVLRSDRSLLAHDEGACVSDIADRTIQRRYNPKANAITTHEQNRNKPSIVPTWSVTISHPAATRPAVTTAKLKRNINARSDIV
jgi:hypothetical protein